MRSYTALMQQFAAESTPQAKKRKLDHQPSLQEAQDAREASLDHVVEVSEDADQVEELELAGCRSNRRSERRNASESEIKEEEGYR